MTELGTELKMESNDSRVSMEGGKNTEHTETKRKYFAKSAVSVHLLADG